MSRGPAALVLTIGLATASCGPVDPEPTTPPTRPSARTTCDVVELGNVPDDLELVDRTLEPLGGTVSGLILDYDGRAQRSMVVTSGGTLEDTIESYDDLTAHSTVSRDGQSVPVLTGEFRGTTVHAALWRDPQFAFPCDARAVVVEGLDDDEFQQLLVPPV